MSVHKRRSRDTSLVETGSKPLKRESNREPQIDVFAVMAQANEIWSNPDVQLTLNAVKTGYDSYVALKRSIPKMPSVHELHQKTPWHQYPIVTALLTTLITVGSFALL